MRLHDPLGVRPSIAVVVSGIPDIFKSFLHSVLGARKGEEDPFALDVFENPYGALTHRVPKPPSNKKYISKTLNLQESPEVNVISPKANVISPKANVISPKVNVIFPKVNFISPKVNVKYFLGIFEEFKIFEIFCLGVTVTGVSKYLTCERRKFGSLIETFNESGRRDREGCVCGVGAQTYLYLPWGKVHSFLAKLQFFA